MRSRRNRGLGKPSNVESLEGYGSESLFAATHRIDDTIVTRSAVRSPRMAGTRVDAPFRQSFDGAGREALARRNYPMTAKVRVAASLDLGFEHCA